MAKAKAPQKKAPAKKATVKKTVQAKTQVKAAAKAAPAKSAKTSKPAAKPAKSAATVTTSVTTKSAPTKPAKDLAPKVAPKSPTARENKPQSQSPAAASAQSGLSWSESLRKAMQDKHGQTSGPEHDKSDWKNRQRSGLSITHRNKFG